MKKCPKCLEVKPLETFGSRGGKRRGEPNSYCRPCSALKRKESSKRPNVISRMLQYHYGITYEQYQEMHTKQQGRCAICNEEEKRNTGQGRPTNRLAVDHCHKTGKVRGLLCMACNTAVGAFKDDIEILFSAVTYLEQNSGEIEDGEIPEKSA